MSGISSELKSALVKLQNAETSSAFEDALMPFINGSEESGNLFAEVVKAIHDNRYLSDKQALVTTYHTRNPYQKGKIAVYARQSMLDVLIEYGHLDLALNDLHQKDFIVVNRARYYTKERGDILANAMAKLLFKLPEPEQSSQLASLFSYIFDKYSGHLRERMHSQTRGYGSFVLVLEAMLTYLIENLSSRESPSVPALNALIDYARKVIKSTGGDLWVSGDLNIKACKLNYFYPCRGDMYYMFRYYQFCADILQTLSTDALIKAFLAKVVTEINVLAISEVLFDAPLSEAQNACYMNYVLTEIIGKMSGAQKSDIASGEPSILSVLLVFGASASYSDEAFTDFLEAAINCIGKDKMLKLLAPEFMAIPRCVKALLVLGFEKTSITKKTIVKTLLDQKQFGILCDLMTNGTLAPLSDAIEFDILRKLPYSLNEPTLSRARKINAQIKGSPCFKVDESRTKDWDNYLFFAAVGRIDSSLSNTVLIDRGLFKILAGLLLHDITTARANPALIVDRIASVEIDAAKNPLAHALQLQLSDPKSTLNYIDLFLQQFGDDDTSLAAKFKRAFDFNQLKPESMRFRVMLAAMQIECPEDKKALETLFDKVKEVLQLMQTHQVLLQPLASAPSKADEHVEHDPENGAGAGAGGWGQTPEGAPAVKTAEVAVGIVPEVAPSAPPPPPTSIESSLGVDQSTQTEATVPTGEVEAENKALKERIAALEAEKGCLKTAVGNLQDKLASLTERAERAEAQSARRQARLDQARPALVAAAGVMKALERSPSPTAIEGAEL